MRESNSPLPFWDYCLERRVHIYNMTARDYPTIRGMNPHTLVMGEEEIFQIYASSLGMNGHISASILLCFPITRKFWGTFLVPLVEQEMRWHSGS